MASVVDVHGDLAVQWFNVSTGASGGYRVPEDFGSAIGNRDERVDTGAGNVVVTVARVLTALPGQPSIVPGLSIAAPVALSIYVNEIP